VSLDAPTTRRLRRAARILLADAPLGDPAGRLLLFRFTPPGTAPFWVTPGGECEPHEDFPEAARRELLEETGIIADPGAQLAQRGGDYTIFTGEAITADERYFLLAVTEAHIDTSGHTALEQQVMREHRWFTRAELANWPETIYPLDIVAMLEGIAADT
jgi:8-oxo-dGTP pyrophosphatase MutT (NUDIX family)